MSLKSTALAILAYAGAVQAGASSGAQTLLDPIRPLLTPDSASAKNPLGHLGANGPWQPGPDVFGISDEVPEGCVVDQAAYISRHGSRYPDPGAHKEWLDLVKAFKSGNYKASGPMAFIHDWDTPLSDPNIQIAQLSKTGYKELFDMGYTLRIRYPDLYREGENFYVWANKYPRVLQTAKLFVQGYLGANSSLGTVVSVSGKGFPEHLGDTLAPSDMCPTFVDDSSAQTGAWQSKWLPGFKKRLLKHVKGGLNLTDSQWSIFPYICGFESQIRGRLSPFCDTFNNKELEQYEYQQDLRYYYGVGPPVKVASKMMVPYLDALIKRFVAGPDAEGTDFNGGKFKVPKLLMSFLNDGQLNQLVVASGIFDNQKPLPVDKMPNERDRLWRSSRISPMRGNIAFERLTCGNPSAPPAPGPPGPRPPQPRESTFVRIRLNDAVYPLPSCQDGPGKSCSVQRYAEDVGKKLEEQGSFAKICNATDPATPTKVAGASFFTNLAQSHLEAVKV